MTQSMSTPRRCWSVVPALLVAFQPVLCISCASETPDKRILQYLNREGFGKRYIGNAEEENYVTIGDRITFVDSQNPEVRGTQEVEIDGTIQLPEVGAVFVAGLTRSELESYLTQKLSPYYLQTDIKVVIAGSGGRAFYVLGQVQNQGRIPFPGDLTVFEAVMLAVPTKYSANLSRVRIIRPDPVDPLIIPVDLSGMMKRGDSSSNVLLKEYDIVWVPGTFLQRIADFVAGLLTPFLSVFNQVINVLFRLEGNQRYGRRNNNNNVF